MYLQELASQIMLLAIESSVCSGWCRNSKPEHTRLYQLRVHLSGFELKVFIIMFYKTDEFIRIKVCKLFRCKIGIATILSVHWTGKTCYVSLGPEHV